MYICSGPKYQYFGNNGKNYLFSMNYVLTETQVLNFLRRRFSVDDLNDLVRQAKYRIDNKWDENAEESVYGIVRQFMSSNINDVFNNIGTEQDYWDSYLKYETPLVSYLKSKLDL